MLSFLNRACKPLARRIARLGPVLGLVTAAACTTLGVGGGGPAIDTDAPVPVALLVPGGSGQASDEVLARSLQNAARLAISDLGGVRIDLRVYQTGGSPGQAQAMAVQAVDEGAKIILGPVFAQEANAVGVAVASRGVNVLSFSNNTDVAGGNVFVLGPTFRNTAARLGRYAVRQGQGRIMVVHDRTTAGEVGRAAIETGVRSAGGTIVGSAAYEFSQNGIVAAVPGIAATARSNGAQALFFTADTAGALPLVTQLLSENGVNPATTRYIGLTRWDIPPATLALPSLQGGWFALPDPGLYAQYQSRYAAAFGEPPHPISGLAYDGIAAIGALVKSGQSNALTGAALTQGAGFVGVNGIFRLRGDGTNERGLAIAQIRNNQVVVIEPAPRSFAGAGF
jgi:ABC-type branched-subunit amino acid transport system substrate-binding protein